MTTEAANLLQTDIESRLVKRLLHACLREQFLPYSIEENRIIVSLKRSNATIIANHVRHFNLGKFKIHGDVVALQNGISHIINDISYFLKLIHHELHDTIDASQWKRFVAEINNCNTNEIVVAKFMQNYSQQLIHDVTQSSSKTLFEYISNEHSPSRQIMFYEAWATQGHPYHPCHKTKLGFSTTAYLKYSPEFNQDIHLPIAAIDKSIVHVEAETNHFNYNEWFAKTYPQAWLAWLDKMTMEGLSTEKFYPIFIHPWQYENTHATLFHDEIVNKKLILFHDIYINTKASLSFRTLIVNDEPHQPHIKLPVAVHSTSAMRTITPASIHNGPKIGNVLGKILQKESHLNHFIRLASEVCGMHIKHPDSDIAKHLGIIYRINPANFVNQNQCPIVVAALFETSPVTQSALLIEIIHSAAGDTLDAALNFFDSYCRIVITAYLDLFLIYGVALEGHQQNTIAVFENKLPKFMIARDLGGVRIHAPTLLKQGFDLQAHPDSATITNNRQEVTNKFLHSVIQYHLGEIILLLSQYYQVPEEIFWKIIRDNLDKRFHEIKDKVDAQRWEQEYKSILIDDWQIKGLMRMRLNNVYSKYIYINLKNPLRDL